MKKSFTLPELTIDLFAAEDVIAASVEINGDEESYWWAEDGDNGHADIF